MNRLPLAVSLLLFFVLSLLAQPAVDPELLRRYGSASGTVSSERMERLLGEYQKQKRDSETKPSPILHDSDLVPGAANEPEKPVVNPSLYEMLLQGVVANPDSQLAKLATFGYDIFSQAKPSTFAPADFGSVSGSYPINAGDEIVILLWGRINEEYRLKVSRDGTINMPRIGPLPVAGLTFETMRKNILAKVGSIEGVHATVSMGELRSVGIYIVGEVASPGFYTVSSLSNVTNALFAAGGPTKRGSLRNIQLKRNGRRIAAIDFYDFLLSGSNRSSLRLQSGDVIHVPIVPAMAAIAGNVRRPGLYELKGKTTLKDLIDLAGGLAPSAWTNRLQVERYEDNAFQSVLDVDSTRPESLKFALEDGDIVKIFPVLSKDKNAVYLSGNVWRPGKYEFREGMHILDVLPDYEALLPETYFDYGMILRQEPPSFLNRVIPFNINEALADPSAPANLALMPKDEVIVYHKDFFEPNRSVTVGGSVTKPGPYKLLENMRLRDLILQAGGLREEASNDRGELYRRSVNGSHIETRKIEFCVSCAMSDDPDHNLPLLRSDRVFIRQKKGWEEERTVVLSGQFVFPGTYVIFEGETLGDLVKRAGGFAEDAYLDAAVFTRESVREHEQKQKKEFLRESEITAMNVSAELAARERGAEAQALLSRQEALRESVEGRETTGRVIIDLTDPSSYDRFVLHEGDAVFVPRMMNTISVLGEVYNPATFTFDKKDPSPFHYVETAGGFKESADKKRVYVVKANGSVVTRKMQKIASVSLKPGDAVVVPQKTRTVDARKIIMESIDSIVKVVSATIMTVTLITVISK